MFHIASMKHNETSFSSLSFFFFFSKRNSHLQFESGGTTKLKLSGKKKKKGRKGDDRWKIYFSR